MIKKSEEKLVTAKIDFDNNRFDDAVSRAYYAIFHIISATLLSKGLHFSSHAQVIGAFNKEFIKIGIFPNSFTRMIQNIFEERQVGDYDFENEISLDDAKKTLLDAKTIVESCKSYLENIYTK
ncbi:MAG: HEPN domain-containing protein [Bacteroidetes bacterium]|nr:HEPN domain-containing protein [Bacteroidota bacterium]